MKSLAKLSRGRRAVWIDPDQVMWSEAVREGATLRFIDGQDLTVDQSPDEIDSLCRNARR
jgi:hypothetical protein